MDSKPFLYSRAQENFYANNDPLWWLDDTHLNPEGYKALSEFIRLRMEQSDSSLINIELSKEIIQMHKEDQEIRIQLMQSITADGDIDSLLEQSGIEIDERNTRRMKEIVKTYGWPTVSMVGGEAAVQAIFLVIHADRDTAFQNQCLSLMEIAVKNENISLPSVAVFTDRVLVSQEKKQLYGTQGYCDEKGWEPDPIMELDKIDDRRKAMGLSTYQAYKTMMDEQCKKYY